jgi:hypothetical protein
VGTPESRNRVKSALRHGLLHDLDGQLDYSKQGCKLRCGHQAEGSSEEAKNTVWVKSRHQGVVRLAIKSRHA